MPATASGTRTGWRKPSTLPVAMMSKTKSTAITAIAVPVIAFQTVFS